MNIFKRIIFLTFMIIFIGNSAQAVPIPLRGVVEGFYGTPWTFEDRADIIIFCRQNNLNSYIYAPKDDPYHRDKWRMPYPSDKLAELTRLVELAHENKVRFIFAVSPGLDLKYKSNEDFNVLIRKLDTMYQIGVRDFAIFFDDLKDENGNHHENGKLQARFLNRVQKNLRSRYKDVAPLITVPTEYYFEDMFKADKLKPYTRDFAETLDPRIVVLASGRGVVCDGISDEEISNINKVFGREIGIWWNYPVNDYSLTPDGNRNVKLALGAVEKLPTTHVTGIFFNPMEQVQLSKIALATGALYANNPATYDSDAAWDKVLNQQFDSLAPAMKIFATHSRHMENSWAKVGEPDAPEFAIAAKNIFVDLRRGVTPDFATLELQINQADNAANILLRNLPNKYLTECKPQLEQLKRLVQADKIALNSLKMNRLDPQLITLRNEIAANEKYAILSELAARKFIDDTLEFFGGNKNS